MKRHKYKDTLIFITMMILYTTFFPLVVRDHNAFEAQTTQLPQTNLEDETPGLSTSIPSR
jgi:hypothetical protein